MGKQSGVWFISRAKGQYTPVFADLHRISNNGFILIKFRLVFMDVAIDRNTMLHQVNMLKKYQSR